MVYINSCTPVPPLVEHKKCDTEMTPLQFYNNLVFKPKWFIYFYLASKISLSGVGSFLAPK